MLTITQPFILIAEKLSPGITLVIHVSGAKVLKIDKSVFAKSQTKRRQGRITKPFRDEAHLASLRQHYKAASPLYHCRRSIRTGERRNVNGHSVMEILHPTIIAHRVNVHGACEYRISKYR